MNEQTESAVTDSVPLEPPSAILDDAALTKVHPNYKTLKRIGMVFLSLVLMIPAAIVEALLASGEANVDWPNGIALAVWAALALLLIFRVPRRRYDAMGFAISEDRLRVARGIWFRSDTVVPFGRVQHLDVQRGPLERLFGLSTLVLHTAGNHNASVSLPGLEEAQAIAMREEIRDHIKRQTL